jgi:DNA-binding NarL/FixJ family response regulator
MTAVGGLRQGTDPRGRASPRYQRLTERELDVFRLVGRGLSNTELAQALHLSEATVKTHLGQVMRKFGLRDRVQAVVAAYESGLVQPGTGPDVGD